LQGKRPGILLLFFGSAAFTGYTPFASGTAGSACALALYWFIPWMHFWPVLLLVSILFFALGVPIAESMERYYGNDPSEVVLDEVVGMWLALLFVPLEWYWALLSFLIFRAFDIVKPPPARQFDHMNGGLGIMLDDAAAGIYANIVVQILILIFSSQSLILS